MGITNFDQIQTKGDSIPSGGTTVLVYLRDADGNILLGTGTTVPTTPSNYAKGGMFIKTDAATGVHALYENTGTLASGIFDLVGALTAGEITLAEGSILVGNATGVATALSAKTTTQILVGNGTTVTSVAMSGDATMSNAGVVTVASATTAFNVGTNQTFTKEVNHTAIVSDSTTANTAGGTLGVAAGKGTGTAAGGALTLSGGASSNGTAVNPGAGGAINVNAGVAGTATTGTAGAGGNASLTASAGGASTGASSTGGRGGNAIQTAGAGGNSSGGGDTGGAGGSAIRTAGAAGTGATAGVAGAIFDRSGSSLYFRKMGVPTAKTTSASLTAAEVLGGWITVNQGGGAGSTMTLPTGTDLKAALPSDIAAGDCFDFTIINISTNAAEDATLAVNTDITAEGSLIVPSNEAGSGNASGTFRIRFVSGVTFVVYRTT